MDAICRRSLASLVLFVSTALVVGCMDSSDATDRPRLVVGAASSMHEPLSRCAESFGGAEVRLSFAGSDALAAQLRQRAPFDVYVAANEALPAALAKEGLVDGPVGFATNELVIATPRRADAVDSLGDLARPGISVGIGAESVPAGVYARAVLAELEVNLREKVLANVRSEEPDVKGVVGKLLQGALDAGLVYRTDVNAALDRLRAVRLPKRVSPPVVDAAAAVRASDRLQLARAYVDGLVSGPCRRALDDAGFGPPPR